MNTYEVSCRTAVRDTAVLLVIASIMLMLLLRFISGLMLTICDTCIFGTAVITVGNVFATVVL